jgi:hypothetical protein
LGADFFEKHEPLRVKTYFLIFEFRFKETPTSVPTISSSSPTPFFNPGQPGMLARGAHGKPQRI